MSVSMSTAAQKKALLKARKRTAPALTLYTHPPSPPIMILGKKVIFAGSWLIYTSMAFIAGYLDAICLTRFGVYVTMSTGNLVIGAASAVAGNVNLAVLCFTMTTSTTIIGGLLCCYVMELFPVKAQSLVVLNILSILAILFTSVMNLLGQIDYHKSGNNPYVALTMATTSGALLHWTIKLGYTHALYTINLLKCSEALYRTIYNISQGGAKLRGDLIIVLSMLTFFIFGSFAATVINLYLGGYSFLPVMGVHVLQIIHFNNLWKFKNWLLGFTAVCAYVRRESKKVINNEAESKPTTANSRITISSPLSAGTGESKDSIASNNRPTIGGRSATPKTSIVMRLPSMPEGESFNESMPNMSEIDLEADSNLSLDASELFSQHHKQGRNSKLSFAVLPDETFDHSRGTSMAELLPSEIEYMQKQRIAERLSLIQQQKQQQRQSQSQSLGQRSGTIVQRDPTYEIADSNYDNTKKERAENEYL